VKRSSRRPSSPSRTSRSPKRSSSDEARDLCESSRGGGEAHGDPEVAKGRIGAAALVRLLALPVALLLTAIVHWPALDTFFAQDDVTFLSRARGLSPVPWSMARPLSEGVLWRILYGAFGLNPLPYHAFLFVLHLANVALVGTIGMKLLRSRAAAFAAAVLFGVSSIAFTPLHWTSCLVELTVTFFSLAAFLAWLAGRERGSTAWLVAGALLGFAALVCKESAILFPAVLLVAHFRLDPRHAASAKGQRARAANDDDLESPRAAGFLTLLPQIAATSLYAIAFLATIERVHYVGSEAYSMTASPAFVLGNLATYLAWLVTPLVPLRDAIAAMNPEAWRPGLAVGLALVALLVWQRRERRHPMEVGAAWFLCFLLPVVALAHHTYLYYLYLPLPGLCWMLARAGRVALRVAGERIPAAAPLAKGIAVTVVLAIVAIEFTAVRARERAMRGSFPADKTMREAKLLGNAIHDLQAARLPRGSSIAFINPGPRQHVALVDSATAKRAARIGSYLPLEGALRQGEATKLFLPGVRYLGFGEELPREWEQAEVFLFQDDGHVRALGRGSRAQAELGYLLLPWHEWDRADAMFERSRQLGDTLADATFGLIITRDFLGDHAGASAYAREFLRRWPDDRRATTVREAESKVAR
jgi:hypothetical protein